MWPEKEEEAKQELISMIQEFCETYKGRDNKNDQV